MKRNVLLLFLIFTLFGCQNSEIPPFTIWEEPITKMEFVLIPKGSFYMGSSEVKTKDEIRHKVTLSKDYWLGRMEVTEAQWQAIMGSDELHPEKPSPFHNENPEYPVVSISYNDIQLYLDKLNYLSNEYRFRLPTEAEWEYACRAGTSTNFSYGNRLSDKLANYNSEIESIYSLPGNYISRPTVVGSYPANKWGLYDMHGNAWEWVEDWYGSYPASSVKDPEGPANGNAKVIRGGSWYFGAENARSSARRTHRPQLWGFSIGFRIVCEKK